MSQCRCSLLHNPSVAAVCTARFTTKTLHSAHTVHARVVYDANLNSDYLRAQHSLIGICDGSILRSL
jgi:hypothetical protein